jgi:hypothetical protein
VALSKKVLHEFCADKPAASNDDNFPYIRSDLSAWDIGIHDGGIYGLGVTFRLAAKYLYQLFIFCMTAFEDLALLCVFLCIIECGSVSAAARRGCPASGTGGAGDRKRLVPKSDLRGTGVRCSLSADEVGWYDRGQQLRAAMSLTACRCVSRIETRWPSYAK